MAKKEPTEASYVQLIWDAIIRNIQSINAQIEPKPQDAVFLKIAKHIGRVLMVIFGLLLSPFFLLAIFLAFVAAL